MDFVEPGSTSNLRSYAEADDVSPPIRLGLETVSSLPPTKARPVLPTHELPDLEEEYNPWGLEENIPRELPVPAPPRMAHAVLPTPQLPALEEEYNPWGLEENIPRKLPVPAPPRMAHAVLPTPQLPAFEEEYNPWGLQENIPIGLPVPHPPTVAHTVLPAPEFTAPEEEYIPWGLEKYIPLGLPVPAPPAAVMRSGLPTPELPALVEEHTERSKMLRELQKEELPFELNAQDQSNYHGQKVESHKKFGRRLFRRREGKQNDGFEVKSRELPFPQMNSDEDMDMDAAFEGGGMGTYLPQSTVSWGAKPPQKPPM